MSVPAGSGLQRPGEDVNPWRPPKIEDSKQVELVSHVLRAADLVPRDVEGEELAQASRLSNDVVQHKRKFAKDLA